ncbi:MAG TPA: twin-arginine translocation signal domain-containing protein [Myxococcales bacterium]|nr:twin-arginine translocation signal domain-containing protein [Myxococcales bacterium]
MAQRTRRDFLKTVGLGAGAALFTPFLNSLSWAATTGDIPRRYVFVVEGNCFEPITMLSKKAQTLLEASAGQTIAENWTKRWFYQMYTHTGGPLVLDNTDFETAPALGPVVGKPGELSLASEAAVLLGLSSKVTGGSHSTHHGALSCTRSGKGSPGGPTIDAWLAALPAVRKGTPFDAVRLESAPH